METITSAKITTKTGSNRPNPKTIFPNCRHEIRYSFTINDKDYFEFQDFNDVPCLRGFNALTYYNELSMRCTRDYLLAFTTAMENILNNPKTIRLTEIMKLNMQLKERLEFIIEPKIALKLCTVYFFSAEENPYMYNYKKGAETAELFEQCGDDFFFSISSRPITQLIPYIASLEKDFQGYCQTINQMTKEHLSNISTMLSEKDRSREFFKSLKLPDTLVSQLKK